MSWEPILEDELADRAWKAVYAIADDLTEVREATPDLALFFAYLAAADQTGISGARAEKALSRFGESINDGIGGIGLFGGLAGAGWVASHLADPDDIEPFLQIVDTRLLRALEVERWALEYDLIGGLAGLAIYFLARAGTEAAAAGRRKLVEHLAAASVSNSAGTTWLTAPDLLPESIGKLSPFGRYDCGLAHGVAGVVGILGRIAMLPDRPSPTASMCDAAISWLVSQRIDGGMPATVVEGRSSPPSRPAWCYGDPGVAIAIYGAAMAQGRSPVHVDGMLDWMHRSPADNQIVDTTICHGSSGLAHISNRFYQATRKPEYRAAAIAWYQHTLSMRRPGHGIGGFVQPTGEEPGRFRALPTLLDGAAGVALSLLSALVPIEPAWDRLLLCDLPVSGPAAAVILHAGPRNAPPAASGARIATTTPV